MCFGVYKDSDSCDYQWKGNPKWVLEMKIKLKKKDGSIIEIEPDNMREAIEIIHLLSPDTQIEGGLEIEKPRKKVLSSKEKTKKKPDHTTLSYRIIEALRSSPWGDRARNLKEIAEYTGGDYNPVSGVLTYLFKKGKIERVGEKKDYQYFLPEKRRLIIGTIQIPPSSQDSEKHNTPIPSGKEKTQKQEILDVLEEEGRPMLAREIAKKLPHIYNENLFRALSNMVKRKQIFRTGRSMNYRYYV